MLNNLVLVHRRLVNVTLEDKLLQYTIKFHVKNVLTRKLY
jgi:hypothetical protein